MEQKGNEQHKFYELKLTIPKQTKEQYLGLLTEKSPTLFMEQKEEMNSTRRSKSRDATSLHPVTKSSPFDLSTAPQ